MILDRNIAVGAAIDPLKIANMDVGEVRYVVRENSNAHKILYPRVKRGLLYVCDGAADQVQINQAISDSKGGTNSFVYCYPGAYSLTGAITLASRSSIHLVGVNGYDMRVGCLGAAALTQTGAYENIIMEAYGQVTGFQIINKAGYSAITMADGKWRANIHNNYFHMTQGTACSIISCAGSGMSHGNISHNRFETWVGGSITSAILCAGSTAATITDNWINNYLGTMDTAIDCGSGAQMMLIDNIIGDNAGAGTITTGIALGSNGNIPVGNRFQMATGTAFTGGSANRSFVDNRDAYAGGATPIET
jgi:hypothetical protein